MCLIFNHGGKLCTLLMRGAGNTHKIVAQFLLYNWIQYEKEIIFSLKHTIEVSLYWHPFFQLSDILYSITLIFVKHLRQCQTLKHRMSVK